MKYIIKIIVLVFITGSLFAQPQLNSGEKNQDSTDSIFNGPAPTNVITFVNTDELNDFEGILSAQEELDLKTTMYSSKKFLFSVVTTSSYDPYMDIKEYTYAFGASLPFNMSNLVVLAVSKNKLGFYILAGSKVQLVLTNVKLKEIMDEVVEPELKDGDFFMALKNAILAISKLSEN